MVFTFSGYNLFHLIHVNIVAAVAHIPWILLFVHGLVSASDRKTRVRSFIALTLVVASQILVGHTQQVWFTLLLVGGLCAYFLWSNIALARVLLVPLALGVAALVAGVQLLPLFDVVTSSPRSDWAAVLFTHLFAGAVEHRPAVVAVFLHHRDSRDFN